MKECLHGRQRRSRRLAGLGPENGVSPRSRSFNLRTASTSSTRTSTTSRLNGHSQIRDTTCRSRHTGPQHVQSDHASGSMVTRSSQTSARPNHVHNRADVASNDNVSSLNSLQLERSAHNTDNRSMATPSTSRMGITVRQFPTGIDLGVDSIGTFNFDIETASNSSTTSAASNETLPVDAADLVNSVTAPANSSLLTLSDTVRTAAEPSSSTESENSGRTERRRRPRWRARGSYLLGHVGGMRGPVPVRGQSYCDCPKESRDIECRCGEGEPIFEWSWDKSCKSAATDLLDNSRDVRFHINYSSGTAAIRGNKPLFDRQHFWEIKMTTPVYGTDMMVGIGTYSVDMDAYRHNFCSLLGKDGESWGLSYYGRLQHKGRFQTLSGSRYGQGSIIGLHLDMWHGTLGLYKNRRPLGIAYRGLAGKKVFPMVSSTAARTGMKLIRACSFTTSLQFLCCQVLRRLVPHHLDVTDALSMPPGLQAFLQNNLSWLLRPSELSQDIRCRRKRGRSRSQSESSEDETDKKVKRQRTCESSDDESQ